MRKSKFDRNFYHNFKNKIVKIRKNYKKSFLLTRKFLVFLIATIPVVISLYIIIFINNEDADDIIASENNYTSIEYYEGKSFDEDQQKNNIVDTSLPQEKSRYNLIVAPNGMLLDLDGKIVQPEIGKEYNLDMRYLSPSKSREDTLASFFEDEGNYESSVSFFHPENIEPDLKENTSKEGKIIPTPDESSNKYRVKKKILVPITAYSSTKDQTDETPFITAFNTNVYWGVVAANFLPYGTKLRIPAYYGDKIFTVEDRMNERYPYRIDVWTQTRPEAENFGIRTTHVEILQRVK